MNMPLPDGTVQGQEMALVADDGTVLSWRLFPNPTARVRLVLSHGNGLAMDGYQVFWRSLLADFEVVVFDFRGHGRSQAGAAAAHHWTQFEADMQALCDALAAQGDARPLLGVFHSLSAVTSLRHLHRYGPCWDALVLVDPPLSPPPGHAMESAHAREVQLLAEGALRRRPAFESAQQLAERFARVAVFGAWQAHACMDMALATLLQADGGGVWQLRCAPEREALVYRSNIWPLAQQVLANCPFPVHLLAADATLQGSGLPARYALDLHQNSAIGYTSIAGTGHFLQLEQPQACADAIAQFVRQAGLFASADTQVPVTQLGSA